jgi:hypothetical protein
VVWVLVFVVGALVMVRAGIEVAARGEDLARKMHLFVDAGPAERSRMGAAGRGKMEREYDQELVITAYKGRLEAHAAAGYPA